MSQETPQNPIFRVDVSALDACCPKALCRKCGTVMPIRLARRPATIVCPACGTRHQIDFQSNGYPAPSKREDD